MWWDSFDTKFTKLNFTGILDRYREDCPVSRRLRLSKLGRTYPRVGEGVDPLTTICEKPMFSKNNLDPFRNSYAEYYLLKPLP